ncbi:endo-beta-N-acetylglucosaminidase [Coprinopsis cinerea okayama7|uniref:Endo-beta-N-acetylglucosaminidase n=1 Tax=Coprinopsis cinerea (strain Okayama-7 / 130 / ATCC MYA-4618 / FGSC 9003) TaxID=240176 RepID=D6RKV4_COPC7|nr:endo-beta-N-acetylglucosaminidase [Coprinopsis cinerea okayama7\|eukprot:XP_002911817.1 endo-beta-N-acetylglucosaminidase [Coprinopsis cinerea okayama7\
MPVRGTVPQPRALPEYFQSFQELDDWRTSKTGPFYSAEGVRPYVPRRLRTEDITGQGRLLIAHDFKVNTNERRLCPSIAVLTGPGSFAHHRITIPPPEWIASAHRQGVPILGTLGLHVLKWNYGRMFEGEAQEDCFRMVIGTQPRNATVDDAPWSRANYTVPVSPHYAEILADIAKERGFDGWLINIEMDLKGGSSQARGIAAWVSLFQQEVLKKVGSHGLVLWYDSVTFRGHLSWQERLSSRNLPFFLSSSGLFTNYAWYNHFPQRQIDYFNSLDPKLLKGKSLQDIYAGIDMWGRGSHGGGGFGMYKALEHADPQKLGLSIALLAPGWTWESENENPGWTWERFWEQDTNLWVGPSSSKVAIEVPPTEFKVVEPMCEHGPFKPVSKFFPTLPPPDPLDLAFYTSFSPGVGHQWFVEGKEVFYSGSGWTDIEKQTSTGDLVWPKPTVYNLVGGGLSDADASSALYFEDAWNGGNSLQINVTRTRGSTGYAGYWVPIQSLSLSTGNRYEASVVYKVGEGATGDVDAKLDLGVRGGGTRRNAGFKLLEEDTTALASGWAKARIVFEPSAAEGEESIVPASIGFIVSVSSDSTKSSPSNNSFLLPFLVGQIAVHPHLPADYHSFEASLYSLSFKRNATSRSPLDGMLSWDIVAALPEPPEPDESPDRDDPNLFWEVQPTERNWFPKPRTDG